jgi:undecaprenyl-diphosphatase
MAAELTALGGYTILVLIIALTAITLTIIGESAMAVFLVLAFGTGSAVSSILKLMIERPRPDVIEQYDRVVTASFPSGHAMVSMLTYLTLATVVVRLCKTRKLRIFVLAVAGTLSVSIGISRVYLGVHWPTDVLAGWSIGIVWAGLCWLAAHYLEHRRARGQSRGQ